MNKSNTTPAVLFEEAYKILGDVEVMLEDSDWLVTLPKKQLDYMNKVICLCKRLGDDYHFKGMKDGY